MRFRLHPLSSPHRVLISLFAGLLVASCSGDDGNNGLNSLVAFAAIPVGNAECPDGGTGLPGGDVTIATIDFLAGAVTSIPAAVSPSPTWA